MFKAFLRSFAMLAVAIALVGCTTVSSTEIIGKVPQKMAAADFNGVWNCPQLEDSEAMANLTIQVADADAGTFNLTAKKDDGKTETVKGWLRTVEGSDWVIASVAQEKDANVTYVWALIASNETEKKPSFTLFVPDPDKVKKLIEDGVLPGDVTDKEIKLKPLSLGQLQVLTSESHGVIYNWQAPVIYFKK